MKSIFSQIFKSSLFNHVWRLAIVVVFLSYSAAAAANWNASSTVTVKVAKTGHGLVYANQQTEPTSWDISGVSTYTWNNISEKETEKIGIHNLHADPDIGYYLDGWYEGDFSQSMDNMPQKSTNDNPYRYEGKATRLFNENPEATFILRVEKT